VTKFRGKHWSFGITYTTFGEDWMTVFRNNKNADWQKNYSNYSNEFNLDWFMTFLRDTTDKKIKAFYVENLCFIHWATFVAGRIGYAICNWKNGILYFPMFEYFSKNKRLSEVPISEELLKFDTGLKEKDYLNFGASVVHMRSAEFWVDRWEDWLEKG
jgi:hypothetical protein